MLSMAAVASGCLTACGGGESSVKVAGYNQGNDASPVSYSGIVMDRSPLAGATVDVQCLQGSAQAATDDAGLFSVASDLVGFPCVVRATSADQRTVLYSYVPSMPAAQAINVLPLTDLVLSVAAGAHPATVFAAAKEGGASPTWVDVIANTVNASKMVDVAYGVSWKFAGGQVSIIRFSDGGSVDLSHRKLQSFLDQRSWSLAQMRQRLIAAGSPRNDEEALVAGLSVQDEGGFDEFWAEHFHLFRPSPGEALSVVKTAVPAASSGAAIAQTAFRYDPIAATYIDAAALPCLDTPRKLINPNTDALIEVPFASAPCGLDFYAGSSYQPPSGGLAYRLITVPLGEGAQARFQLGSLSKKSLAGQSFSSVLGEAALAGVSGTFSANAYSYTAEMFNLDEVYVVESARVDSGVYATAKEFSLAHIDQMVCGVWPRSSTGKAYGITFDAVDESLAYLWPVQDNTCIVEPGASPTTLTASWPASNPQMLFFRQPAYFGPGTVVPGGGFGGDIIDPSGPGTVSPAQLQTSSGVLGVSVDSSYVVICYVDADGHVVAGTYYDAFNRFKLAPTSGVFLNRAGINDVLRAAGQPALTD